LSVSPTSPEPFAPEVVLNLCAYTRFPERLKLQDPSLAGYEKEDEFGVLERLRAIEAVFGDVALGRIIDLGGNSGYFALSLLDSGRASHATVVDLDGGALAAGRTMALAMGLEDRIDFVEQKIDLGYVRAMASHDTVICLNLIHHGGALYDIAEVDRDGWAAYARQWLAELRSKSTRAIIGVGFKGNKPVNWDVPRSARLFHFQQILEETGWSVLYDSNVEDIRTMGVARANGRRRRGSEQAAAAVWRAPLDRLCGLRYRLAGAPRSTKLAKYHLFLIE